MEWNHSTPFNQSSVVASGISAGGIQLNSSRTLPAAGNIPSWLTPSAGNSLASLRSLVNQSDGQARWSGMSSMTASNLMAAEAPPQVANSFLEATERLLKDGSQYKQKHEDASRSLAGTFLTVGAEQHPESVKDFLDKKRQEARGALIESEASVCIQAKRREAYLTPDIEWEKFKENAVSQYLGAGSGGMLALLRSQKQQRSLDVSGSQLGDRQLTKEELLFIQTLRDCNDEILTTHSAVSNLLERFSAIFTTLSTDKAVRELWNAFSAVVGHARSDARAVTTQDQVAAFRSSESFNKLLIAGARSYLELSAYTVAEEQVRNPVRDVSNELSSNAASSGGESTNVVVAYARAQLSKSRLSLGESTSGTRLHGVPVWALIYSAIRLGALRTAVTFCSQGDESTRDFARYITEYQRNNGALLASSLHELQTTYRNQNPASGNSDLYKQAVMAIISRAEPEQDFGGIIHSVHDWLWTKLAQTDTSASSPSSSSIDLTLQKLQHTVRSRFPAKQTDDCEAFLAFVLTGQFELAVERLFLNVKFRSHAAFMAIGLKQAKVLLISHETQLASVLLKRDGLFFLDLASVVRIYADGFRRRHLEPALEVYFHLSETPAVKVSHYDHQFSNLFEFCVYKLAKDTGNYAELFGVADAPGTAAVAGLAVPRKGLVHRLLPDATRVVVALAQDLIQNGELVEGLELYETTKQMTAMFRVLLKVLADDVLFPTTARQRQSLLNLATKYAERFQVAGGHDDVTVRNVYVMLDLLTFLNRVDNQEYRQALAIMRNINLIPLEQNAVGTAVAAYQADLLPEVRECIPFVTLQTMQALVSCYAAEKERILSSRIGAEVGSPLRTANLLVSGVRLSDGLIKLQATYRKQSHAILDFGNKIPSQQLPNLMDLLIKLEGALI
ncbi:putative Nuclear pore complex protein Nup93 [Hypsibius exemplaris]|uniref:Nuclear pore protein n=1 Tax=Hypsibius exemplaris TaxID=2072580 RepID=A0A1W0X938_HYPEX|nr:putative Nuclear pore complex protein Nup93 [Hypsibius exemplaris]